MKTSITARTRANKTDEGNGPEAICRVSDVLRSPSPDPRRLAHTMKFALILFLATCFLGCSRSETERTDLADRFVKVINKQQKIVFIDSSNLGASMDGAILSLHFFPNSKVHLFTWGNGFSDYLGTYKFTENNGIELSLEDQSWPPLRLLNEGNLFIIERQDGLKSLSKSFIHTDQNGVRTKVDDGDIYPEARSLIFPLTQRVAAAEQTTAEQPATPGNRIEPSHSNP